MDTELARTFLEIVSTGSFIRAGERLHVSQTAVSARIRSLESQLGRPVFVRNKAGASLTPAGEKFLRYAPSILQMWERARHDVAVPPGRSAVLAIGGELALWDPLLLNWLLWMKHSASDVALRVQVATQETLMRQVAEGVLDLAIMYAPQILPGLTVEQILDEKLVLVTTDIEQPTSNDAGYVYIDWGMEFAMQHGVSFPDRPSPTMVMGLGPLGLRYILEVGGSGYFRMSSVRPYLVSGRLKLIPDAPEMPYPVYVVYATRDKAKPVEPALHGLKQVASRL